MFERILGRLRCLFGRHHRSKRKARLDGLEYVSVCAFCGIPMRQRGNKDWIVEKRPRSL
jgi:hypothetical protein